MESIHLIIELFECEDNKIKEIGPVREIMNTVLLTSGMEKIFDFYHQFEPYGVSGICLVKQSHISIHTWPEKKYVAMDIYTCGDFEKAREACKKAIDLFNSKKWDIKEIKRGVVKKE